MTTNADLPVVILCGGQGTRLREVTERVPKPLVEVGGKPLLWHLMKVYGEQGFRRFVLCLGYKGFQIKDYFLHYREHLDDFTLQLSGDHEPRFHGCVADEDWTVTCIDTGELTGTGGRLRLVREFVDTDEFMFTYGDGIGDIDLRALLDRHRSNGLVGTVTGVHPTSRYGEMRVEASSVLEFNEKPTHANGYVSGGFFALRREIFNYLGDDLGQMFEAEPLQKLARDGQLAMHCHDGYWLGMDTYRDWEELNRLWLEGTAPWKVWV
jgi:glucose-1-phosphate cytidylyltransferase